jgi:hypothetical protein
LNPTLQKSGLKREIKSESQEPNHQILAVFFVEPIKETQKNTVPENSSKEEVNFY